MASSVHFILHPSSFIQHHIPFFTSSITTTARLLPYSSTSLRMKKSFNGISLLLGAIVHLSYFRVSEAILPTSAIDVSCGNRLCDQTLLASQAFFGSLPAMSVGHNLPMIPIIAPADDPLLCLGSATDTDAIKQAKSDDASFVIVAPRGQCTFESKALAAQNLGASAIVITGNLASRYSLNETTNEVVYPAEYHDYDCDKATADIPTNKLSFDVQKIPYDWELNDPVLSGTAAQGNLCAAQSHSFAASCPSEKCLLTGTLSNNGQSQTMKACCAWDKHIYLYSDKSNDNATTVPKPEVNIPALYITMREADDLYKAISTSQGLITVTLYRRYYPQYNLASIIIWALGVFVAAIAAWLSASEYRSAKFITQQMDDSISDGSQGSNSNSGSSGTYERVAGGDGNYVPQEESLELNAWHAIGFIVFSTMGLLILFIFKIYNVVKIFYAFGCSSATFQVIFFPLFYRMAGKLGVRDRDRIAFTTETLELGDVTYVQIWAAIASYGLGTVWTVIAFTQRHPDAITFFWVTQDIFGAAMCVVFLSTMKLNSIRVASILLSAAFFYDIFFVFVTPLLTKGGKSIMVDVATSGGAYFVSVVNHVIV